MPNPIHVASPPAKALLIYDGDCHFCYRWVLRWQRATGDVIGYLPFQDKFIAEKFPEIPRENFERAVHFISPDGKVSSGAEAALHSLATAGKFRRLFWLYQKIPPLAAVMEFLYRQVAKHRSFLSRLDRFFFGGK